MFRGKGEKTKSANAVGFFGLYAGEEVILDESSVPIPDVFSGYSNLLSESCLLLKQFLPFGRIFSILEAFCW